MNVLNFPKLCTVFNQMQGEVLSLLLNICFLTLDIRIRHCGAENTEWQVKVMAFNGLLYQSSAAPTGHLILTPQG
jgi:hypothetical protein